MTVRLLLCLLISAAGLAGCTAMQPPPGVTPQSPRLEADHAVMEDGTRLPVDLWLPPRHRGRDAVRAVAVALHGFNDYRNAYADIGPALAAGGVAVYAVDQRGFGDSDHRGLWAGTDRMVADLRTMVALARRQHPGRPVYVLGISMGAAVAMVAATSEQPLGADGLVISAPAVWGRETMPGYQRLSLEAMYSLVPGFTLTGRGLRKQASDNIDALIALGRDDKVIKETRVDTIYGLVGLMDRALASADKLTLPSLILYGLRDEIVPRVPSCRMLKALPPAPQGQWRALFYKDGWHLLLRDLKADKVRRDIIAWMVRRDGPPVTDAETLSASDPVSAREASPLCR